MQEWTVAGRRAVGRRITRGGGSTLARHQRRLNGAVHIGHRLTVLWRKIDGARASRVLQGAESDTPVRGPRDWERDRKLERVPVLSPTRGFGSVMQKGKGRARTGSDLKPGARPILKPLFE
jgi:hypothetical protein